MQSIAFFLQNTEILNMCEVGKKTDMSIPGFIGRT